MHGRAGTVRLLVQGESECVIPAGRLSDNNNEEIEAEVSRGRSPDYLSSYFDVRRKNDEVRKRIHAVIDATEKKPKKPKPRK